MRFPLIPLAISLFTVAHAGAQTITWGNTPGDTLLNSADEKLTDSWKFELGVFLPGFFPTESNIAEWVPNWVPLDSADYNEKIGYFSSRAPAPSAEAGGLQAYIWIFNERKYNPESEWLLITDRDGNHSNDWMVPNRSADPAAAVVDWRVSRATVMLMGHAPRMTAKRTLEKEGEKKAPVGATLKTAAIPNAAIIAANKADEEKGTAAAVAGDVAEEFADE